MLNWDKMREQELRYRNMVLSLGYEEDKKFEGEFNKRLDNRHQITVWIDYGTPYICICLQELKYYKHNNNWLWNKVSQKLINFKFINKIKDQLKEYELMVKDCVLGDIKCL